MTRAGQGEARESGVFGLVADVVSTPAEYETAIEAVLGERLQYVIVESHSEGVEAIDYLKTAAEGRASLIPLARLRGAGEPEAPGAPADHPGIVAPCLDVVRFDPLLREGGALPPRRRPHRARPPRRARDLAGAGRPPHPRDPRRRGARPVRRRHRWTARGRGARSAAAAPRGPGARGDGARLRGRVRPRDRATPHPAGAAAPARGGPQDAGPRRAREGPRATSSRRRTSPASARSSSTSGSA